MAVKKEVVVESQTINFTYEDGSTASFELSALKPEIITRLALHGLSQKLGDSYAGDKNSAPASTKQVFDGLLQGDWSTRGEGGPRVTQLARAVERVTGKPLDEIVETLGGLEKDERKALQSNAKIAEALAAIRLEDAKAAAEKAAAKAAGSADDSALDLF